MNYSLQTSHTLIVEHENYLQYINVPEFQIIMRFCISDSMMLSMCYLMCYKQCIAQKEILL